MKKTIAITTMIFTSALQAQQFVGEELLMGAQVYGNSIKIQVHSGGCTTKQSFLVKKSLNRVKNSTDLTFFRIVADKCEAYIPEGRVLNYSMSDLRLPANQKFNITNSFVTN